MVKKVCLQAEIWPNEDNCKTLPQEWFLNYFLTPLLAFTVYFCFLHSFRHSISLVVELDKDNLKSGTLLFIKKAMPLTFLTAVFYIISLYFLSNYYQFNDAIIKIIFIGLASVTFPHILLEYLLEKNEK